MDKEDRNEKLLKEVVTTFFSKVKLLKEMSEVSIKEEKEGTEGFRKPLRGTSTTTIANKDKRSG